MNNRVIEEHRLDLTQLEEDFTLKLHPDWISLGIIQKGVGNFFLAVEMPTDGQLEDVKFFIRRPGVVYTKPDLGLTMQVEGFVGSFYYAPANQGFYLFTIDNPLSS